jgi:NitT/TauT family transport system substrate-binding protein
MHSSDPQPVFAPSNILAMLLVLALWAGALLLPVTEQGKPLMVAVGLWPGAEPWVLAREQGELDPAQARLVEINWTSAAMRAVGNRVVDAAILSLDEVILQVNQGYPLKVVMVTDISRGADLVLVKPGINSVADLRGRRVGYEPRTAGAWLLGRALAGAGFGLRDIHPVVLNPNETQEAFDNLPIDAIVCTEPWPLRLGRLRPLYDSSHPGAAVVRVLAVHAAALSDHREALVQLVQMHGRWAERLRTGGAALEPVLRREGVSEEGFRTTLAKIDMPALEQSRLWLNGQDDWLFGLFRELRDDLPAVTTDGRIVQPEEVFDPTLLEGQP